MTLADEGTRLLFEEDDEGKKAMTAAPASDAPSASRNHAKAEEALSEQTTEGRDSRVYSYNEAVDLIGLGAFHAKLILICGWANATDAVELMCVSLAMPSVQCELGLSSAQLGWISAIVFVGMMIGGYTWGSLGDVIGRKPVVIIALVLNAIFGFLSAFARTFWPFLICRFLSGLGVGGSIPVIWSYFIEWCPSRARGSLLSCLATFWMIGQLIVCGIAWGLIPSDASIWLGGLKFDQWRIFLAVSTFICASSAVLFAFLPESPKYLLQKGRPEAALDGLRNVYHMNKGAHADVFPVKQLEKVHLDKSDLRANGASFRKRFVHGASNVLLKTKELLEPPHLRRTVILIVINFVLAFGYYGLTLWFPELFTRSRASGDENASICARGSANGTNGTTSSVCANLKDKSVFRDNFLISLSSLPGNIITIVFLDILGRKVLFVAGIVLSAVSAFLIYVVKTATHVLIMSCIFGGVSVLSWNCLDAFMSELFPTHLRSTSMGVSLAFARLGAILGNVIFGRLVDVYCSVPLILVACLLSMGAVVSLFLPDVSRKAIE